MKIDHELKIWPCYYKAVINGNKTFEIRNNRDRGFQKGDVILLREWDKSLGNTELTCYTGNEQPIQIIYVTNAYQKDENVVFGFKLKLIDGNDK